MTDLERAFDQLRGHTTTITLPPPQAVRQRGDRRRRARAAVGLLSVAVLAVVASGGAAVFLDAGRTVKPGHTPTPPPSPAATPTPSPSPTTSAPTAEPPPSTQGVPPPGCGTSEEYRGIPYPYAGTPLPGTLMLNAGDWDNRCFALVYDAPGYETNDPTLSWPSPAVCWGGREYATHQHRIAGRFRTFSGGPESGGSESVTRYAPGRAAEFLDEIRTHLESCAVQDREGERTYTFVARAGFAGDESMLIYQGVSQTGGGHPGTYQAVVRVGDLVAIIFPGMDGGGDADYTVEMARKAVAYLQ